MSKKTILVVDDVELNRSILEVILSNEYRVLQAKHGLEAYDLLTSGKEQVSLILLDIVMPVMDGFDFLQRIQKREALKKIPVIFVTSETYQENILQGLKMGVRDVIAKPFQPEEVLKRVNNLIALAETREQAPIVSDKPPRDTVLIVDDIALNRVILTTALGDHYRILEAENGQEALDLLQEHNDRIAVMLLDIVMPVLNGYEVMRLAKIKHLVDNIPVIAITAEDSPQKQSKMLNLGISEVIDKPFVPAVVETRVSHLAELYRGR